MEPVEPPPTPIRLQFLLAHHTDRPIEHFKAVTWQALLELPESKRPSAIAGAHIDIAFLCMMGCRNAQEIRLAGIDTIALLIDHLHIEQLVEPGGARRARGAHGGAVEGARVHDWQSRAREDDVQRNHELQQHEPRELARRRLRRNRQPTLPQPVPVGAIACLHASPIPHVV